MPHFRRIVPILAPAALGAAAAALLAALPAAADGFDLTKAAEQVLAFIKLIIVVATAVVCVKLVLESRIVPAATVVVAAAVVYVLLNPETMRAVGEAVKKLVGLGAGGGSP